MTSHNLYIYGFSVLILSNVCAIFWNETEFLNVDGRDSRRIRNKLVTFDTTDTDIELAFQFNIPFVAVPTDRSGDNIKNSITSLANLNLGSIALASVMIAFGTITSYIWKLLLPKVSNSMSNDDDDSNATNTTTTIESMDSTTITDDNSTTTDEKRKSERAHESNRLFDFMDLLDATMNPTVCFQQYICSLRKASAKNVAEGYGDSSDKIIDGIFESPWILDMISGTAVHDAIQFAESRSDCEGRFSKCGFQSVHPEDAFSIFLKILKVFG